MAKEKKVEKVVLRPKTEEEKAQYIKDTIVKVNKAYGEGSAMRMGENSVVPVDVIPTGCLTLDAAIGVGGLPRGRIIEIYGPESSGKTTLALQVIAEAQKLRGNAVFIDAEHALDPSYAEKLGVKVKDLILSQPDNGEQALDIAEKFIMSGSVDVIVVDSVAALTPKAEIDGEMGQATVGAHARLMSQAMRRLTAHINKSNCCVIFINQMREKVGGYGNPETTTGGKALKFYSTVRLDVRRKEAIKEGEEVVGNVTKVTVVKNKVSPPFRVATFTIRYGKGIDREACVIDVGEKLGIVKKSGAWFSYNGEKLGQGESRAAQYLREHPELAVELDELVHKALREGKAVEMDIDSDTAEVVDED